MKKKKKNLSALVLLVMKKHPFYVSIECFEEKRVDLLLTTEKGKRYYALVKDFNTFTYAYALHRRRKHFLRYCLQALSTKD